MLFDWFDCRAIFSSTIILISLIFHSGIRASSEYLLLDLLYHYIYMFIPYLYTMKINVQSSLFTLDHSSWNTIWSCYEYTLHEKQSTGFVRAGR